MALELGRHVAETGRGAEAKAPASRKSFAVTSGAGHALAWFAGLTLLGKTFLGTGPFYGKTDSSELLSNLALFVELSTVFLFVDIVLGLVAIGWSIRVRLACGSGLSRAARRAARIGFILGLVATAGGVVDLGLWGSMFRK